MRPRKILQLGIICSISFSAFSNAFAQVPTPGVYTDISIEQVRDAAKTALRNAIAAGRLSKEDEVKFASLDTANSLSQIEQTWAELEAKAQEAKSNHLSIDHLITTFSQRIDRLAKAGVLQPTDVSFYRKRIDGLKRLHRQFTANNHKLDFWQFNVLAIDLSCLQEKLNRSVTNYGGLDYETFDELVLRSDMSIARNAVGARGLETFKSYVTEPEQLMVAKNELLGVLKDRANSRMTTPEVKANLTYRLYKTMYDSGAPFPSEEKIDYAIKEVQRLIDSGVDNGNLGHADATRLQQELELVKALKRSYPGSNPGIDPFERELRMEELQFMATDLRFMQDWLAQVLRNDGDADESRQQLMRVIRRTDLAYFTHRISKKDVSTIMANITTALKHPALSEQMSKCKSMQGLLDMMIADYSWKPVDVSPRFTETGKLIARLRSSSAADSEKSRIETMLQGLPKATNTEKIGAFIVAGTELEMLRNKVKIVLKDEQTKTAQGITPDRSRD